MTEYEILRLISWALLGLLLIGFAIMEGFDLGTAALLPFVGRSDIDRRVTINTVGSVWKGNQVWFILGRSHLRHLARALCGELFRLLSGHVSGSGDAHLAARRILFIIMGSTHGRTSAGFAPLAIGLGLTLIHLVSIPITNTSVNPARSAGPALIVGGWALTQFWLFWFALMIGGALGGVLYRWISAEPSAQVVGDPATARRPSVPAPSTGHEGTRP
jgi:hypothetical protein